MRRIVPLLIACLLVGLSAAPAAKAQDSAPAAVQAYSFATGAGILFFYVRPDRTTDFEAVVARLSESLDGAHDAVRRPPAPTRRMF